MTGKELISYLNKLPAETLEQQIIFEVNVMAGPGQQITGHVPIVQALVVDADAYLLQMAW